jgi:hypothetical protein
VNTESNYGTPFELGRFLRNDWLKESNSRIHLNAFLPPENILGSMEISCFEVQNLSTDEVFTLADDNEPPILLNQKPPVGFGVLSEQDFARTALRLDFDDKPPRHVNIIGWENFPNKEDCKLQATTLAEYASCAIHLR